MVSCSPSAHLTLDPRFHEDFISRSTAAARHLAAHAPERHAAYFLRQAALAENVLTSAFHTLQAAEALSGRARRRTDYVRLKRSMGEVLIASSTRRILPSAVTAGTPLRTAD
jgi:hypothetical protein